MKKLLNRAIKGFMRDVVVNECNDCTEVSFPFLDRKNESINVYIHHSDRIRITDDGYILSRLFGSGRADMTFVINLIERFRLKLDINEIILECKEEDFSLRLFDYLQVLIILSNL